MTRIRADILGAVLIAASAAIGRAQASPDDPNVGAVAIEKTSAPKRVRADAGPNFGTSTEVWQDIPAEDFEPIQAYEATPLGTSYTSSWNPATSTFDYRRYITEGISRLLASPHLPGGALITSIQYDYCDTGTGSATLRFRVYDCNAVGNCVSAPLDEWASVPGEGCVAVGRSFPAYTVDNPGHKLLVEVAWENYGPTLQLAGVSFGYRLQVSPAPASPTFGDVPVSDLGFPYIEALVASGITAGCGGGNYCPDNALTRRQMAVFLAKALGLNWSQ